MIQPVEPGDIIGGQLQNRRIPKGQNLLMEVPYTSIRKLDGRIGFLMKEPGIFAEAAGLQGLPEWMGIQKLRPKELSAQAIHL